MKAAGSPGRGSNVIGQSPLWNRLPEQVSVCPSYICGVFLRCFVFICFHMLLPPDDRADVVPFIGAGNDDAGPSCPSGKSCWIRLASGSGTIKHPVHGKCHCTAGPSSGNKIYHELYGKHVFCPPFPWRRHVHPRNPVYWKGILLE